MVFQQFIVHVDEVVQCGDMISTFTPFLVPPAVNLSTEDHSILVDRRHHMIPVVRVAIINADIGIFPVRWLNILNPVHIIFFTVNAQLPPHASQGKNVRLVCAIKSILVLYLEHDYWVVEGWCLVGVADVWADDWGQGRKVYWDLLHVLLFRRA